MTTMRMSNVTGVVADDMEPTPGAFRYRRPSSGSPLSTPTLTSGLKPWSSGTGREWEISQSSPKSNCAGVNF